MLGKKCLLYAASFAALLIVSCIVFSNNTAYAGTDYDNSLVSPENLEIYAGDNTTCQPIDVSYDWYNKLTDNPDYENVSTYKDDTDDWISGFDPIVETGSGWGVGTQNRDNNGTRLMAFYWTDDDDIIFRTYQYNHDIVDLQFPHLFHYIQLEQDSSTCEISFKQTGHTADLLLQYISTQEYLAKFLFINTDYIVYPQGYEGDEIAKDYNPEEKEIVRPDFEYNVSDKNVQARDGKKNLPSYTPDEAEVEGEKRYFKGYSTTWTLTDCGEWDDYLKTCGDPNVVNQQVLDHAEKYEFDVTSYGDYTLQAEYTATECYRYNDYPTTPDYCYVIPLGTKFPDKDFQPTTVYLKVDGSIFTGSTKNEDCDVSGFCQVPDDGLGFFRGIDNINTFGLQEFFIAPINFYGTLPAKAENCSAITVPFLSSSFQLTCLKQRYYDWSPTIMTMYSTILTAVVGYAIATKIFGTIKRINSPDDDGIEVAKL